MKKICDIRYLVIVFCIDNEVLGTEKKLLVHEDGFSWLENAPTNVWYLTRGIKHYHPYCLNSLFQLNGLNININPPERFVKAMNLLMSGSIPPWREVLPQDEHRRFVEDLVKIIKGNLHSINLDYFNDTWRPGNGVLRSLLPARVDSRRFMEIWEESGMNRRVIEGLRPDAEGYASPIVYDRFGTRTGRLTVASGPGILTMKKEYRNACKSSFVEGKIISLDFSALEVRVLLYEANGRCDSDDLYSHISQELFGGSVDRKSIKAAVIAESYGSSKHTLLNYLNISSQELDVFVEKIRSYLRLKDLRDSKSNEFWKNGYITNRFGRRVQIEEPQGHIFVNSYAQSSGVDISLMGFSSIVEGLIKSPGVRPLFVLHDELILDVAPHRIQDVVDVKSVTIPGYAQVFPIKYKIIE